MNEYRGDQNVGRKLLVIENEKGSHTRTSLFHFPVCPDVKMCPDVVVA